MVAADTHNSTVALAEQLLVAYCTTNLPQPQYVPIVINRAFDVAEAFIAESIRRRDGLGR